MLANVTIFWFLGSYALAFALELLRMYRRSDKIRAIVLLAAVAGLAAHTLYLFEQSRQAGLPPLLSSTHDWMLVLAWMAVVIYLFLTLADRRSAIGLFLLPLVLLLTGSAYFISDKAGSVLASDPDAVHMAIKNWAMLHASLLVFGIAMVGAGFLLGMMYLVQHRRLKQKQAMHSGLTLPSLETLARMNWWAIMTSIPLLALGMLTGLWLGWHLKEGLPSVSLRDPVVVINGALWVLMAGLFCWLRFTRRPAARQVAWMTVWAFGFLLVTLVGLELLTGGHFASEKQQARRVDSTHLIGS